MCEPSKRITLPQVVVRLCFKMKLSQRYNINNLNQLTLEKSKYLY